MSAKVLCLPGVDLKKASRKAPRPKPNPCLVKMCEDLLADAKAGILRSGIFVGEGEKRRSTSNSLCDADLHVLQSLLALEQRRILDFLEFGADEISHPPPEAS